MKKKIVESCIQTNKIYEIKEIMTAQIKSLLLITNTKKF